MANIRIIYLFIFEPFQTEPAIAEGYRLWGLAVPSQSSTTMGGMVYVFALGPAVRGAPASSHGAPHESWHPSGGGCSCIFILILFLGAWPGRTLIKGR